MFQRLGIHHLAPIVMLAGLLAMASPVLAVGWETLAFEQLSFIHPDPDNDVLQSAYGQCVVEYGKDPEFGYLNVAAMIPGLSFEPVWIVRNMPLADIGYGPPVETCSYRFPLTSLGIEDGMPVPMIEYGYTVTPEGYDDVEGELFAATTPLMNTAPVQQVDHDRRDGLGGWFFDQPKEGEPWTHWYPPFGTFWGSGIDTWIGCYMPNVPLNDNTDEMDDSACAPASCANSLAWLDSQHPEIDVPDNQRQLLKELSTLMNRARGEGASAETMARAKLDFIEAHNLPIHVKIQNWHSDGDISSSSGQSTATDTDGPGKKWPTPGWLKSEASLGEDVEMCVGYWYKDAAGNWHRNGGHAIVLSGSGTHRGTDWVTWKHDAEQSTSGGLEQGFGRLVDTGDGWIITGMGGSFTPKGASAPVRVEAYLESVVSESYDPSVTGPSSSDGFGDYCDYITRTIAPGKHLAIEFPTVEGRSMDVTVCQLDRDQNPPTQRSLFRWTNNSGKTRSLHNPTDIPITVKIHNDDMDGEIGWFGLYIPYMVNLQYTDKSLVSPDPSNFELTGGFSLGGNDGYCEFGPAVAPTVWVDYTPEMLLDTVPSSLGAPGGTFELWLQCQIPMWNGYWEHLGLVVDVLDVVAPGDLFVESPSNGFVDVIPIAAPGRYKLLLGDFMQAPDFQLRLEAQAGLEIVFDAIGVPTVVPSLAATDERVPDAVFLAAARPNPFNPSTLIEFGLDSGGHAELAVYDVAGRRIRTLLDADLGAGRYTRRWSGRDQLGRAVAAGTYIYRLQIGDEVLTRKMQLVK